MNNKARAESKAKPSKAIGSNAAVGRQAVEGVEAVEAVAKVEMGIEALPGCSCSLFATIPPIACVCEQT